MWLNALLAKVAWWVKVIILTISSFLSTLLPLPINLTDISFLGTIEHFKSISWLILITLLTTALDTVFGVLTYSLANMLSRIAIKSDKSKERLEKWKDRLLNSKLTSGLIFIAMITPLPFTLTIYASSIIEYDKKKLTAIIFIGRLIKYSVYAIAFYYGIKLFS